MKTEIPLSKPIRRFLANTEEILDTEISLLRQPDTEPGELSLTFIRTILRRMSSFFRHSTLAFSRTSSSLNNARTCLSKEQQ